MIPINQPILGEEEEEEVVKILRSGVLSSHSGETEHVMQFEKQFAKYIRTKYAIALNSGTAALHASLIALGIGPGDEVIVPAFSFAATANVVLHVGATPVFVDVDPEIYNILPEQVEEKITEKTKAIIPVHLYGHPAEMLELLSIARDNNLKVIEDSCQAHGSEYNGKKAGSIGDLGCFSFYPTKVITTGEGGIITTNNSELAEKLYSIHAQGKNKNSELITLGHNFRMPEISAAIGQIQLKKLPKFLKKRSDNARYLTENLDANVILPKVKPSVKHNWYLYTIQVHHRDNLEIELRKNEIGATVYYRTPIHKEPLYINKFGVKKLINSEELSKKVLSLPVHPLVTTEVLDVITKIVKNHTK